VGSAVLDRNGVVGKLVPVDNAGIYTTSNSNIIFIGPNYIFDHCVFTSSINKDSATTMFRMLNCIFNQGQLFMNSATGTLDASICYAGPLFPFNSCLNNGTQ